MTTPRRFTTFSEVSPEGRLLAAGRAEYPDDTALRRAAARLGIPAVAIGAATAAATLTATTATTATAATMTSTSAATATASTALPSAASSILTVTFLKAAVVGVALGAGTIGTADFAFRNTPPKAAVTAPAENAKPRSWKPQLQQPQAVAATPTSSLSPVSSAPDESSTLRAISEPAVGNKGRGIETNHRPSVEATPLRPAPPAKEVATADFEKQSRSQASATESETHLASEVESLDRARTAVSHGDARGALRELDDFASRQPYRQLAGEVMLVRIEALLALGNRTEAAALARQLLQLGAPAPHRARLERLTRME